MIMPDYKDLYFVVATALEEISRIIENTRQECEELCQWGMEETEEME